MERWYRVFGGSDVEPAPPALLEHLHGLGLKVTAQFHGDDQGWSQALLALEDGATLTIERYLATEEGIRAELNTWAAWVESAADDLVAVPLMQRLITTQQVITLQQPSLDVGHVPEERVYVSVCRFLARLTEGIYQVDDLGFCTPEGELLVAED